ncbi:MAG: 3-methyladenine DNA glycosylase [Candidatus Moranbacteria bacterium CG_4_9_14_3_um_filter_42_9]|nr:MAG: 3-methyladenine DNA glycosylase [Candidatus Moranbacteria bacterium CG_4_9_14_3_um_filter_42_9]
MKRRSEKTIIGRKFYQQPTLKVAQDLLGCFLIRKIGQKIIRGKITETEAYIGEDDLASHASKGRTPRTKIMYGEAGHAYVYMVYGMYHCLNVVTEKKNFPAAVLIRGIEIENNLPLLAKERAGERLDGPGKLCRFLKIDRKLNGWDLTTGDKLWVEKPAQRISKKSIVAGRRIGVDYARHCKYYLWRFALSQKFGA